MAVTPLSRSKRRSQPELAEAAQADPPEFEAWQAAPAVPARPWRRRALLAAALLLVAGAVAAVMALVLQQTLQVQSRNAVVRGQLTEAGTRLSGILATVEVREGEQVKAGQVLARLDDRHLRSEQREAQAQIDGLERELLLERANIELSRAKLESRLQETLSLAAAADAEVAAAQSRVVDARESYRIRRGLAETQAISQEEVRAAESRLQTTQALLDVARANGAAAHSAARSARLDATGMNLREERLQVLQAGVRAGKARLERAGDDIESALIRAPADGALIRWLIKPGGSVEVGKPVAALAIGTDTWIEAWIDEDEIHRVKLGGSATVTLPSHGEREFTGVVEAIGLTTDFEQPVVDVPQPRFTRMRGAPMVGVRIRLKEAPSTLLPGLSATVSIRSGGK